MVFDLVGIAPLSRATRWAHSQAVGNACIDDILGWQMSKVGSKRRNSNVDDYMRQQRVVEGVAGTENDRA